MGICICVKLRLKSLVPPFLFACPWQLPALMGADTHKIPQTLPLAVYHFLPKMPSTTFMREGTRSHFFFHQPQFLSYTFFAKWSFYSSKEMPKKISTVFRSETKPFNLWGFSRRAQLLKRSSKEPLMEELSWWGEGVINLESELCLSNLISSLRESRFFPLYFDDCQHLLLHRASNIKILWQSYLQLLS